MLDGVLNIYKEKGYTSHDVVAKMRGILRQKKIGHTGTLDPDAEGVLPVCLGKGTRLCDMLTDHSKVYRAVLLLGIDTDPGHQRADPGETAGRRKSRAGAGGDQKLYRSLRSDPADVFRSEGGWKTAV